MTLSVKLLGLEILTVELESNGEPVQANTMDRGIKWMTRFWTNRMAK